jgi:uridylate kinase
MKDGQMIVVSLGGSLIVPDTIDTEFLIAFKQIIDQELARGRRFVIITGGGNTARAYQRAAKTVSALTPEDVDWLGIHATRLNAHLLRTIFYKEAHPIIVTNAKEDPLPGDARLIIAAGFRPGASTDLRAVELAQRIGAQRLINLSNIDYVYEKDPKQFPDAKPITEMAWAAFRKILPDKWGPGLNSPFDPVAAREAEKLELEVAIINGNKLDELQKYLDSKAFTGTRIHV